MKTQTLVERYIALQKANRLDEAFSGKSKTPTKPFDEFEVEKEYHDGVEHLNELQSKYGVNPIHEFYGPEPQYYTNPDMTPGERIPLQLSDKFKNLPKEYHSHFGVHGVEGKKHFVIIEYNYRPKDIKNPHTFKVESSIPSLRPPVQKSTSGRKKSQDYYTKFFDNHKDAQDHMDELVHKYHKMM